MASWIAAATSYSVHGLPMLPVYIYYSMFGFQRVGDLIWAAADQRSRGLLFGATAGRTTLGGEGLQHQDGSSLVMAAMVPNCRAWEPAFAGELAVILDHAMRRMLEKQHDEFHYVTLMNESYPMPSLPEVDHADLLKGMYRLATAGASGGQPAVVRLLGSGAILREVIAAGELLREDWGLGSEVFSVTSYSELARDAAECSREVRLGIGPRESHLERMLPGDRPIVAASDQVRAWPQSIAEFVRARFLTLGTDGFGRSDTRARLRRFFEVDRHSIVLAALQTLCERGELKADVLARARERYSVDAVGVPPWHR
jgi:pyruvate dehydrogenase E1 component